MERTPHDFTALRMVCSECQRRKQKCNKQWPCNHCTRRKVADKCRYNLAPTADEAVTVNVSNLKRRSQPEATSGITEQLRSLSIGYVTTEMLAGLGIAGEAVTTPDDGQFWADAKSCDALNRTLKLLPKGHRIDALLEAFLGNANPQFYIIYPAKFLEEYGQWRVRVSNALPIGLHWTCLLLSVIACSIQHIHTSARDSLERELGDTVEALSERYHSLSRELSNAIPPGYEHLLACQWLLQSAYWYISQAKYRETWHVLSAAVRQAQQLGLDSDSACTQLSEFEREMQRRVWCIIQILDWQISAGLSRPTIVRWANAEVRVPAVTMEGDAISPMLHLIVQSQLITRLATNYSDTTKVSTPQEVCQYGTIITEWALSLPRPYALENPDTSMDSVNPWIVFNRHYLHVVIYFMRLTPLRRFMLQEYDDVPSEKVHSICLDGFRFCMEALRICQRWADHVAEHGGGYHFVVSSAFDSMTLFCTALIKGIHGNVMKYMDINETIDKGLLLLSRLRSHSPEAKTALDVMRELVQRVPVYGIRQNQKRQKLDHVSELVTSQPMANQVTATSSTARNAAFVDIEVPEVPFTMPTANVLDASISTTAPFASLAALSIPAFAPVLPSVAAEDQALLPTSLRGGAEATQFLMVESIPIIGTNMLPASADDYTSSITDPTWYSYDNALWDWGAIESGMYQHDESGK